MPPTMIFDGECVLCSGTVQFVLAHEKALVLRFTTTQSEVGRALARQYEISPDDLDLTFVLVDGEKALLRSDAALRVASHLRAPWGWLGVLRVIPRPLRDAFYSAIARRRYRLFGRRDTCFLPAPEQRHRFLLDRP